MRTQISRWLRDPITWAEASQLAKTVGAAVVAGVGSTCHPPARPRGVTALLTVHVTVFGTLRRAAQQAGASLLGVLIAAGASQVFGAGALALGATVLVGMLAGAVPGLRAPMTTATTAVVVLTTGYIGRSGMLTDRLIDTGIGIVVGLLMNLLVWPPLRDRAALRHVDVIDDRLGELLSKIAADLRDGCDTDAAERWIAQTDRLDRDVDRAWHLLEEARQSGRFNPRRGVPQRMRATEEMTQIINRLAQAVAETRSFARTIRVARIAPQHWDPGFREPGSDCWSARARPSRARTPTGSDPPVPSSPSCLIASPPSGSTEANGRCSERCSSTSATCSTPSTSSPRPAGTRAGARSAGAGQSRPGRRS